jgi:predicted transcriptional regulator of viral defense system
MRKSYQGISKLEIELINKLEEREFGVFRARDISILLSCNKTKAYNIVKSLYRKKVLQKIGNGRYVLSYLSRIPELLELSAKIIWPSYISLWTALSYYRFTEQLPKTIYLCTTRARKSYRFEHSRLEFIKISPYRFFGYTRLGRIIIAEKEKALLDSLLFTRYSGGIEEVFKCLKNAWEELDKEKLTEYAFRLKSKSLLRRLGYFIEHGGLQINGSLINRIHKNIGRGIAMLEPGMCKGIVNRRWRLRL